MPRRHPRPLPRLWLMTDERMGEGLWPALARLPRGAGVVFRHHATPPAARRALLRRVEAVTRARRLRLVVAPPAARRHDLHGVRRSLRRGLVTRSAHGRTEALRAVREGADLLFVSPVFATRSHPGGRALGAVRLGLMIRDLRVPVVALGGMDATRFRRLRRYGVFGWAAIDAWTR